MLMGEEAHPSVRWGIVGTGGVSGYFISDLHLTENAEAVSVASRDAARAAQYAAEKGVATGCDFATMLKDPIVDVVYIATPPATHHALARAALEAGKHVVVEKPVSLQPAHVQDLIDIAGRADRFLMEAMWMKFNPVIRRVVDLVQSGAIGEIRSMRASFGLPFPAGQGSRWDAELGGSALFDQGIYPLTLATMLLGHPSKFTARGVVVSGVDTSHRVTLDFDNDRFAQLAGSMVEYTDPSAAVSGTDGWISIDPPFWTPRAITVHRGDIPTALMEPEREEFQLEGFGYVPMIRAICGAINRGEREQSEHTHADTMSSMELLSRIRAALTTGADRVS